jgi:peptidoglycan/LPS O-acetylase OafA/YrhL
MLLSAGAERATSHRIYGLDAIRFVCAMIVALAHVRPRLTDNLAPVFGDNFASLADSAIGVAINGQAAVIVFFVLSGFVVHLPQVEGRTMQVREFYARRLLRIMPPAAIAAVGYYALGAVPHGNLLHTVLWSVYCELAYYLAYPLLLRWRAPTRAAVAVALVAAYAVAFAHSNALEASPDYHALGLWTVVIGAPAWLAGCWLAENRRAFPALPGYRLWATRGAIWIASVAIMLVCFHMPWLGPLRSNIVTLNLFALPVTLWLGLEAAIPRRAPAFLDRLGAWSYSLYLFHPMLVAIGMNGNGALQLAFYLAAASLGSYAFYLVIERPSHRFARRAAKRLRERGAAGESLAQAAAAVGETIGTEHGTHGLRSGQEPGQPVPRPRRRTQG